MCVSQSVSQSVRAPAFAVAVAGLLPARKAKQSRAVHARYYNNRQTTAGFPHPPTHPLTHPPTHPLTHSPASAPWYITPGPWARILLASTLNPSLPSTCVYGAMVGGLGG